MTGLIDWIEYGLRTEQAANKRTVRRWMLEAREHRPIIDRVTYPDAGVDRRLSRRTR